MTLYHKDLVLIFHLQKKLGQLVSHPEFLRNLAFGQIGQWVEIFKLVPRAQFLANQPNSFFLDHIDTRSLGGNHHWVSRVTTGQELRSGRFPPSPALNKLDQRPLYIGLSISLKNFAFGYEAVLLQGTTISASN